MKKLLITAAVVMVAAGCFAGGTNTVNVYLRNVNGVVDINRSVSGYTQYQATNAYVWQAISVTATTRVPIGLDISVPGYAYWRNAGTCTVSMCAGADTNVLLKFYTNDIAVIPMGTTNIALSVYGTENGIMECCVLAH